MSNQLGYSGYGDGNQSAANIRAALTVSNGVGTVVLTWDQGSDNAFNLGYEADLINAAVSTSSSYQYESSSGTARIVPPSHSYPNSLTFTIGPGDYQVLFTPVQFNSDGSIATDYPEQGGFALLSTAVADPTTYNYSTSDTVLHVAASTGTGGGTISSGTVGNTIETDVVDYTGTFTVDYGDGSPLTVVGKNESTGTCAHSYTVPGTYLVKLGWTGTDGPFTAARLVTVTSQLQSAGSSSDGRFQ